jgi:hypothetical protein
MYIQYIQNGINEQVGQMARSTLVFVTVPDSSINSWKSWFIVNLRKINTN